jgi:Caspase domain
MDNHSSILAALVAFIVTIVTGAIPGYAQTLHVISAADTLDPPMGVEFGLNKDAIDNYVQSLAQATNMILELVDVTGQSYSCASIEKAIKNLSVASQDVVIFFHSGHGHSPRHDTKDESASIFPSLECSTSPHAQIPNLEDIFKLLSEKNARITIVGADSCNELVPIIEPKFVPPPAPPPNTAGIRTMFLKYEGTILIASSAPAEFSFYPNDSIGMFTRQFLDALNNPSNVAPNLIWEEVIARATRPVNVPAPQGKQHPPHREELRYLP